MSAFRTFLHPGCTSRSPARGRPAECLLLCCGGFASDPLELPPHPPALTQSLPIPCHPVFHFLSSGTCNSLTRHFGIACGNMLFLRWSCLLRCRDLCVYLIWVYTDPLSLSFLSHVILFVHLEVRASCSHRRLPQLRQSRVRIEGTDACFSRHQRGNVTQCVTDERITKWIFEPD